MAIPDFSEPIVDQTGRASRNWFNYWKALVTSGSGGTTTLTPGQLPGTNTNDDASAGNVGEYVSSEVAGGLAVSLTSNTTANITSISLSAGDWNVWIDARFSVTASTIITGALASISLVSATFDNISSRTSFVPIPQAGFTGGGAFLNFSTLVGPARISVASATTVYFVAQGVFSASTLQAYGHIQARRAR